MPIRSWSEVSFAKTSLPYPVYAADFDPYNRGYLVVGGGGGEGRSGVPNQISVVDVSDRSTLSTAVDIELPATEDSVQSVACLSTRDGLVIFGGINSSLADQNVGKNEHFRSFNVKCPPRKKQKTEDSAPDEKGEWSIIGKRALFRTSATSAKDETYQRLLRLSRSQMRESGSSRIGAVATGQPKPRSSEIVVFNATTATPEPADILTRIDLPSQAEAADLDINESEGATFSLAYCTDFDIYEQSFEYDFKNKKTERTPNGPRRVHQMPSTAMETSSSRPKFRCLRFLNSQNVVAVVNKPNKGGAELRVFHLYPTGPAIQVQQKSLPRRVKQVVSMDVCALDADSDGNQQFILAVAAQDISIEVYTINFQAGTETFSKFRSYLALKDVHKHQMTKICFSPFHAPSRPLDAAKSSTTSDDTANSTTSKSPPTLIRLASVSMGNSVVVDTFPISALKPNESKSRYVLSLPNDETLSQWTHIVVYSLIGLFIAWYVRAFWYGEGIASINPFSSVLRNPGDPQLRTLTKVVRSPPPSSVIDRIASPSGQSTERLHTLLSAHDVEHPTATDLELAAQQTALVLRPDADSDGVKLDVHDDRETLLERDPDARHWHELEDDEKLRWKDKLKQAGHWAEEEGETIFTGILFSEFAGMVGQAAADVLREL